MSDDTAPPSFMSGRMRRLLVLLAVLAVLVVVRPLFIETYTVPSSSMVPTLSPGDRIAVRKHVRVERGDLVVFTADEAFYGGAPDQGSLRRIGDWFGIRPGEHVYVKRVIALPGERVSVDRVGVLRVEGKVQAEPYLRAGVLASTTAFSIRVPQGRYFVMGDNRPASDDSRNHLGDPGGGSVRAEDIVGVVVWRYWPSAGWGSVES
ncbi:signal peptidase I [Yimella sp. cx-51]|uniref:signal peptidase I n=1 Tax=Yimella sp. cx-51 TaxID=2770551 RepID=UPI00165E0C73|nr:signal peptidase I [Yimella sp. cx-51]MBC9956773.1 signal peptidase I [Yimella sp. cx-51]QTH39006.1 signal peptidase I [Yimella sp. cx-51]